MNEVLKLSEDRKTVIWADKSIANITIPEGVEEIGLGAFEDCRKLTSAKLPYSLKKIEEFAFSSTGLVSIQIPEGVEEIDYRAFVNCHKLKSVQLPFSLKKIGEQAFAGTGLVSIQIPEGVTEIGSLAFFNSLFLRSIVIPSTVEIMIDPFVAVELHEAYIYITDLERIKFGGHLECKYLYVPSGKIEAYKQHPVFGKVEHIIEMNKEAYN